MSFTEQIQRILAERRPLAEKVREGQKHLHALSAALQDVAAQRDQLLALQEPAIGGRLSDIDLEPLQIQNRGRAGSAGETEKPMCARNHQPGSDWSRAAGQKPTPAEPERAERS